MTDAIVKGTLSTTKCDDLNIPLMEAKAIVQVMLDSQLTQHSTTTLHGILCTLSTLLNKVQKTAEVLAETPSTVLPAVRSSDDNLMGQEFTVTFYGLGRYVDRECPTASIPCVTTETLYRAIQLAEVMHSKKEYAQSTFKSFQAHHVCITDQNQHLVIGGLTVSSDQGIQWVTPVYEARAVKAVLEQREDYYNRAVEKGSLNQSLMRKAEVLGLCLADPAYQSVSLLTAMSMISPAQNDVSD